MRMTSFKDVPSARFVSTLPVYASLRSPSSSIKPLLATGFVMLVASCAGPQHVDTFQVPPPGPKRSFQVQIHTTDQKDMAEHVVAEAQAWWASLDPEERVRLYATSAIPVEVKWLQPYYRVRIGHFRSRDDARGLLEQVADQFPAAFIVPDIFS